MEIKKFKTKPVVKEATQFNGSFRNASGIAAWINLNSEDRKARVQTQHEGARLFIVTLEGAMEAEEGDWIIKGLRGEFYPCKPDIFEKTYGEVEE